MSIQPGAHSSAYRNGDALGAHLSDDGLVHRGKRLWRAIQVSPPGKLKIRVRFRIEIDVIRPDLLCNREDVLGARRYVIGVAQAGIVASEVKA